MTTAQIVLPTVDGLHLLWAVWLADALILICLAWWNSKYSLVTGRSWWLPESRNSGVSDSRYQIILWFIIVLSIVLRSFSLNSDLWLDEVLSLVRYARHDLGTILTDFSDDNQHILYSALAHVSIGMFGESAAAFRLPAMLFGVGSIWASAHLARYVFGKNEALFTAALLTLSYHHVWFSQNARAYTMLLFGTVVSTELLLRALASGNRRYWLGYAITLAITAWAHLTVVFVALAHGLILLFMGLRNLRSARSQPWQWQPFLSLALAAWLTINLYAPVLLQMYQYFSRPAAGSTPGPVAWSKPVWLINEVLHQMGLSLALGWTGLTMSGLVGLIGLIHVFKRDRLFSVLALAPIAVTVLVLYLLGRSLWPRMFFQEFGFLAAIASVGALGGGKLLAHVIRRSPGLIQTIPAFFLCILLAVSLPEVYRHPKQDFSGARDYVKAHLQPGDTVLGLHMAGRAYQLYYQPDWPEVDAIAQLDEQRSRSGYTWLLYTLPTYIRNANPMLQNKLDREYEIMQKFPGTLGDGVIIVLRSKNRGNSG